MASLRNNTPVAAERDPRLDAYLDAARDCILDVGWRRTTLTEVARRAGVSRMTIYRAWSDMPTLLADLMTREWGALVAGTIAAEPPTDRAATGIAHGLVATCRALRVNELFVRIIELDPELLLPYLLSRRGRSQQAILEVLVAQVEAGQAVGQVRPGAAPAIARALLLTAHGFVISAITMVDDETSEGDLDDELMLLVERSLRP